VRLARVPLLGLPLRWMLDRALPNWEEEFDWALLLETPVIFCSVCVRKRLLFFALLRIFLGWYADHRLNVPRFRLRSQFLRAGMTFFRAPEISKACAASAELLLPGVLQKRKREFGP